MGGIELADVARCVVEGGGRPNFRPQQWKVVNALMRCGTKEMGGVRYECDRCGSSVIRYRSCRNRHCPKCQSRPTHAWLERCKRDLLPVPYFHVVFTLPHALHVLVARNESFVYDLLFRCAKATLLSFGERELGARLGITAVLHTWGQQLTRHVHVHCIVTGGGLSLEGDRWVHSHAEYLFDVKAMSAHFRDAYLSGVAQAWERGELVGDADEVSCLVDGLSQIEWVVYAKPPFAGPEKVLQYLSRYTHRVAITNRRLERLENGMVTFAYRDYRDDRMKTCQLLALRFLKRFLLHVLPKGYVKIRHFGLLAARGRRDRLALCRNLLQDRSPVPEPEAFEAFLLRVLGIDVHLCPVCGQGRLQEKGEVRPPGLKPNRWRQMVRKVA